MEKVIVAWPGGMLLLHVPKLMNWPNSLLLVLLERGVFKKFHVFYRNWRFFSIMSQMNPFYILSTLVFYFLIPFKIDFTVILPYLPRFHRCFFFFSQDFNIKWVTFSQLSVVWECPCMLCWKHIKNTLISTNNLWTESPNLEFLFTYF